MGTEQIENITETNKQENIIDTEPINNIPETDKKDSNPDMEPTYMTEETDKKDTITSLYDTCMLNYKCITCCSLSFYLISTHFLKGFYTYTITLGLIYLYHYFGHKTNYFTNTNNIYVNIIYNICYILFGKLHIYHHLPQTTFTMVMEIVCEINCCILSYCLFKLTDYIFVTSLLDEWILIMSTLLYISTHSINYGYLKVNDIHYAHHKNILTNFGPDFFDILFGTHNPSTQIENWDHIIPNTIIITIIIFFLKRAWNNSEYQPILKQMLILFFILVLILTIWGVHTRISAI